MFAPNSTITSQLVINEALESLQNQLVLGNLVDRQYEAYFGGSGATASGGKFGDTINVRLPARVLGGEGPVIVPESYVESSVPLKLDRQSHVALSFGSKELALNISDFRERVIDPAVANLANKVDTALAELWKQVP